MAKTKEAEETKAGVSDVLRAAAETMFAAEIEALATADKYDKPPGW